jgi:hypothetical protein
MISAEYCSFAVNNLAHSKDNYRENAMFRGKAAEVLA